MTDAGGVRTLLELVGSLLRDHEGATSSALRVIPCITDDLATDVSVISAAVHAAGGAVLNTTKFRAANEVPADKETYRGPVVGDVPSASTSALAAAIRIRRGGADIGVEVVEMGSGRLDARYQSLGGSGSLPLPTADDALLALVRAMCSSRLRDNPLVLIAYDEAEFDVEQLKTAWGLSAHLRGLSLGPRTIVLLAAVADIEPRHIEHNTGFRYAHIQKALIRRHPRESAYAAAADIERASGEFIGLFLGAGFSASSGLALGNALRDTALRDLGLSEPGASSKLLATDWYREREEMGTLLDSERAMSLEQRVASLTLERVLREEYRTFSPEVPPTLRKFKVECDRALGHVGGAPKQLARMIESGRKIVLCTVNFDELIENSAPGRCRLFVTDKDFEAAPAHLDDYLAGKSSEVPLWKLHGSISDLPSCVASDDQTLLGLSEEKQKAIEALSGRTAAASAPSPWIYVGASMRDTDLSPVWGRREFSQAVREYWVSPYSVQTVLDFVHTYRSERWAQDRAPDFEQRLVTETADAFLTLLADKLAGAVP